MATQEVQTSLKCVHCNEAVVTPFEDESNHTFCCQGCLSVYKILNQSNLQEFYSIQEQTGEYTRPLNDLKQKDFDFLDNQDFLKKYAKPGEQWSMSFYLKGVHCLACLWLIEKLPELARTVESSRLDMGKSLVTVTLRKGENSFKEAAKILNNLGYDPYPISNNDELMERQKKEERSLLLKIGIAGFSMMNIMLYTGSVYSGADGLYMVSFGYLSLLLALPVVFYSALPFYQSSLVAIKNKTVNIDIPLSFAILFGFFVSVYFVFQQREEFYFDSITTLIFLILLSRYVLRKAQQTSLNKNDILGIFQRGTTQRKISTDPDTFEEVLPEQLHKEDIIKIRPNEVIPCDGIIIQGETRINLSTLTGESEAILHNMGSRVFMGTVNVGEEILVETEKLSSETRMGQLLTKIETENQSRSKYSYITDKISQYFVSVVFLLAAITFGYYFYTKGIELALDHTLALVIVTCPCALGLATPLTFSRIMGLAQRNGLIFKNEEALERLSRIQKIFFDKTGTLTTGNYQVSSANISADVDKETTINILYSLEKDSAHPVAKALVKWCAQSSLGLKTLPLLGRKEIIGRGVQASYEDRLYEVTTVDNKDGKLKAVLTCEKVIVLSLNLEDQIRSDSLETLKSLRKANYETFMVSGDKSSVVNKVSKFLEFAPSKSWSQVTPEEKAKHVKNHSHTLFVGDGANDSLAFNNATASIATHGSIEMSLRISDIFLNEDRLSLIPYGLKLSKLAMTTVKINLGFSLFYNLTGAGLAIMGLIGPLEAAILMPLSSLTVLAITLFKTRGEKSGNS
jgi:heavy metal translocating P-type ATPase